MKPGTTVTLPPELVKKIVGALQLIQQMDIDVQARDRAEELMKYLSGAENSPEVYANSVVIDDIQSILFDFWLNTPTYESGKTVITLYKEVESLLRQNS
jgi:hypothetical protein